MIPLVDLALFNKLVDAVSKVDLDGKTPRFVWAPTSLAVKSFIETNKDGTLTVNLPGISLFRTQIAQAQVPSSYPMQTGQGKLVTDKEKALGVGERRLNVTCNYELGIFAEKFSHVNILDRVFTFFLINNPLEVNFKIGEYDISHTFYASSQDSSYDIQDSEVSATIRQYNLTRNIQVDAYWFMSEEYKLIKDINVGIYDASVSSPVKVSDFHVTN